MANKTISLPDDVIPIIERLGVPFSTWVADQLRSHASRTGEPFTRQLEVDAGRASPGPPSDDERRAVAERMERSAPW